MVVRMFLCAFGSALLFSCSSLRKAADTYAGGRKLVWADEFNYKGLPDSLKWNYEVGFVRNKEPQFYTQKRPENCRVENGNLVIEARKENYKNAGYTSASIHTLGLAEFQYGRMEVRAKVPKGLGSWSAFWMLGANRGQEKWPECGEIDVMEYVGKDSACVYGTIHYANDSGKYARTGLKPVVGKPYDGYHIYAVDWTKDAMKFFYDSFCYLTIDLNKLGNKPRDIMRKKYYLLLNLALGRKGTLGGILDDKILPIRYYVDYVRVYQ
jgi:beta-glucanase (GH16 family)